MNGLASWWSPEIQALAWALVHFLWQGAVVGTVLAVALAFLSKASAKARYAVALGAMVALALWPLLTVYRLSAREVPPAIPVAAGPVSTLAAPPAVASPIVEVAQRDLASLTRTVEGYLPWLVGGWALGVAVLAAVNLGGLARLRRFRQGCARPLPEAMQERLAQLAERLGVARAVGLYQSAEAAVPMVLGWLRPMIVVPASTLAGLTPQQLDAVLAHELAHVRRHDYLVNLFQTAVETLLFYHPVVWWVSSVLRRERESCCDDLAMAACGDRLGYAKALTALEALRVPSLAMAATGGSLLFRIRRIVGPPARSARRPWLAGLLALAVFPLGGLTEVRWAMSPSAPSSPAPASATSPAKGREGTWSAKLKKNGTLDLELRMSWTSGGDRRRWDYSETIDGERQKGLTAGPDVRYKMKRGEATFTFTGRFVGRSGKGTFLVELDRTFAKELEAMGYGRVSEDRLLELAIFDVTRAWVRNIRGAGYTQASLGRLIELKIYGITVDLVQALAEAGYKGVSADKVIQVKVHGISPDYIRGMGTAGLRELPIDKLIDLKIHGVDPEELRNLVGVGYAHLPADKVIELHIHGVTPAYIRGLIDAGLSNVSASKLVQLKIYGVDGAFVRQAKERGASLTPEDLIELRVTGR